MHLTRIALSCKILARGAFLDESCEVLVRNIFFFHWGLMILRIHANTLQQTRQPESSSLNLKTKQTVQKTAEKTIRLHEVASYCNSLSCINDFFSTYVWIARNPLVGCLNLDQFLNAQSIKIFPNNNPPPQKKKSIDIEGWDHLRPIAPFENLVVASKWLRSGNYYG